MTKIEAIKELPCKVFANEVFHIVTKVCRTEEDFEKFLKSEIDPEMEPELKRVMQEVQSSSESEKTEEIEAMKKQLKALRRKTCYSFWIAVMMNMIVMFAFTMKIQKEHRAVQNCYADSLERDSEIIDHIAETNEMLKKAISKIQ